MQASHKNGGLAKISLDFSSAPCYTVCNPFKGANLMAPSRSYYRYGFAYWQGALRYGFRG